jgi:hypothetical protein
MSGDTLENLLRQADNLTPSERLLLAARLIDGVRHKIPATEDRRLKWRDLQGSLPYPALGEDAQEYISRTRRDDTKYRDNLLKRNP